jgi:hypothetical protein
MIYELRTYTLVPGTAPEYVRLQREFGRPIRGDDYGTFEGSWVSEFGTLNQYVHLWSYQDAGERQRIRAALAQNKDWAERFLAPSAPLVQTQENMLLFPAGGVELTPPGSGKHIYELRNYRTQYGKLPQWIKAFSEVLPVRRQFSPVVALWTSDIGPLNRAVHLWAYESLEQRFKARTEARTDKRWLDFVEQNTPLLAEQQSTVLIPTDFSPLQ